MTLLQFSDLPRLPGYVTVTEASALLGISKTAVRSLIYSGQLGGAFRSGPEIAILETAVAELAAKRKERDTREPEGDAEVTYNQLVAAWNRRVKAWATETGWNKTDVSPFGHPVKVLVSDYLVAHPEDVRPVRTDG